jgi:hypothetical protein
MRGKIRALFVMLVMCSTSMTALFVIRDDINVRANSEDSGDTKLSFGLIFNVTQNLSNVIYDAYSDGELHKGRAFGSKGELYTANFIYGVMNSLGLSNVHKEQIEDVSGSDELVQVLRDGDGNLSSKLDVLNFGCSLNNTGEITSVDCYVSPRWNDLRI